jgi:hypothetical protein
MRNIYHSRTILTHGAAPAPGRRPPAPGPFYRLIPAASGSLAVGTRLAVRWWTVPRLSGWRGRDWYAGTGMRVYTAGTPEAAVINGDNPGDNPRRNGEKYV